MFLVNQLTTSRASTEKMTNEIVFLTKALTRSQSELAESKQVSEKMQKEIGYLYSQLK